MRDFLLVLSVGAWSVFTDVIEVVSFVLGDNMTVDVCTLHNGETGYNAAWVQGGESGAHFGDGAMSERVEVDLIWEICVESSKWYVDVVICVYCGRWEDHKKIEKY